jgi:CRISPR-associated protein Cmr3
VISTHPGLNDLNVNEAREPFLLCGRPEVEAVDKSLGGWIGPANLYFALVGEEQASWQPEQHHPNLPPFVEREHQPGLAIEPGTGTARFGLLYSLESLRFKGDAGLLGSFRGWLHERLSITALESATGNAGRKGRLVRFLGVERFHPAWEKLIEGKHLPAEVSESATFWLLAVTPVRLTDSCIPQVRFTAPWGVSYHVLAALTGHPITLGGYRMATGKSRPNRLYIPAGSAWLIRLEGGNPQDRSWFLRQLNNANSLGPGEEAAFGFGHTLVGLGPAATKENL